MATSIVIFAAVLMVFVEGETKLTGTWSLCNGEDAKECPNGKYANVTTEILPKRFHVGENFTYVIVGNLYETISDPSISLRMKDGSEIDTTIKDEGCGAHKYIFPLDSCVTYYQGPTPSCPLSTGTINVTFTSSVTSLGKSSPDGTAVMTFKMYDQPGQQGNCVLCTATTFMINKSRPLIANMINNP